MSQEQRYSVFCNYVVSCFCLEKKGFRKNTTEKAHRSQLPVFVWNLQASTRSKVCKAFIFSESMYQVKQVLCSFSEFFYLVFGQVFVGPHREF